MKLKTKIILFFSILGAIFLGVAVYYLEYSVRASFKKEILDQGRINAEMIEGTYYAFIKGLEARAVDWSSDSTIRNFAERITTEKSLVRRKQLAEELGAYIRAQKIPYSPDAFLVDLLDANGIVVASTREGRIGVNELSEEETGHAHFFSKAIVSNTLGQVFMRGVVYEEDETEEPMTHAVVRVFSTKKDAEGNFIPLPAVLMVHFLVGEEIPAILSGNLQLREGALTGEAFIQTYKTANVYLINKDKKIVSSVRPLDPTGLTEQIVIRFAEECLDKGKEVTDEVVDTRGIAVVLSSMCLVRDELTLVVKVDSSEAFLVYTDLARKTYASGALFFLVIILTILLGIRRPLRSLTTVAQVASEVAKGNLALRTAVSGKDEIGELAHVFNTMLDRIETAQKEMAADDLEIKKKSEELAQDVLEHEKQSKFLEESKRAQLNLLEDAWQAKEKLELEKTRLQTILSSVGDGLMLIDRQYRIALVNPKVAELFSLSREELLGKNIHEILKIWKKRTDELDPGQWPIEEVFLTRKVVTTDMNDELFITTTKREEKLPVAFSVAPLGGGDAGAVIVIRDITADRALDEAKSGFISVASHQLRTPLTTIRWYAEMLLSGDAGEMSPSQKDFLSEIHGGAERLYQTIDLLLGISRVESGKMKVEKTQIDLGEFTNGVAKELSPQVDEKKLTLNVFPLEGGTPPVFLDPLTLRQVVINLLSNAIRYTNDAGTIEVRWWKNETGDSIVYMVRDNGIGIPESQRSRIFSKFFRAENALAKVPDGSGLGLALIKELVEAWGGTVWFETTEGQGTTFFFTIPLTTTVQLPSLAGTESRGKI